MSELKWDKTDFLVCPGVLPEVDDYETLFSYQVERDGLILSISLVPYESIVELQLRRQDRATNLMNLTLLVGGTIEYKSEKWGKYLLLPACRVVTNCFYYLRERGSQPIDRSTLLTVEVGVDPDLRIECNERDPLKKEI